MTLNERALHRAVWAAVQGALMKSPVYRKKPNSAAHDARVQADAAVIESRIGASRK
jgi:hypothetical protein